MEENKPLQPYAVSRRLLLALYGIIPLIAALVAIDSTVLHSSLKHAIGLSATTATIYILFLELPHIIGSFISYADDEYIRFYKKKILVYLPLLLACVFALVMFNAQLAFGLYVVYTMYHSIKQQTGIAALFVGTKSVFHVLWSYAGIITAVLGNFYIFAPQSAGPLAFLVSVPVITSCATVFVLLGLAYMISLKRRDIGLWYVGATTLLVLTSYGCLLLGYLFFAVLLIRFVHDTTAFTFYAVHDGNRNANASPNILYRYIRFIPLPLFLVTPVLGILIAYYIQTFTITSSQSATVLMLLGCTHYYIEGFMWKRESIHRKQLRFTV